MGAYVHKTTSGPLIDAALQVMLLIQLFWVQNVSISRAQPPPTCLVMDLPPSKTLHMGPYKSQVHKSYFAFAVLPFILLRAEKCLKYIQYAKYF